MDEARIAALTFQPPQLLARTIRVMIAQDIGFTRDFAIEAIAGVIAE